MKKIIYSFFICLIFSNLASAQIDDDNTLSNFNVQLEGTTFFSSYAMFANVEAKILSTESGVFNVFGRAGFGFYEIAGLVNCHTQNGTGGIVGIVMLIGNGSHHFEINGGAFLGDFKYKEKDSGPRVGCRIEGFRTQPLVAVGYRYQKPGEGGLISIKVGFQGVGVALGYAF